MSARPGLDADGGRARERAAALQRMRSERDRLTEQIAKLEKEIDDEKATAAK